MRIYYCDVCDEEITETELIVQLIVSDGNIEKIDFCRKCYEKIINANKKYKTEANDHAEIH